MQSSYATLNPNYLGSDSSHNIMSHLKVKTTFPFSFLSLTLLSLAEKTKALGALGFCPEFHISLCSVRSSSTFRLMARKKTLVTSREGDSSSFYTHSNNLSDCKCYSLFLCPLWMQMSPNLKMTKKMVRSSFIYLHLIFLCYFVRYVLLVRVLRFDFGFPSWKCECLSANTMTYVIVCV